MKRGIAAETLIWILFITISFIVVASLITFFFSQAEGKTAEAICRGSVAARENTRIQKLGGVVDIQPVPLLCRSQSVDIGKDKTKTEVMKELADKMAGCWWEYGEGLIEDVFEEGNIGGKNECSICYITNIKKWKDAGDIKLVDFLNYLDKTVYKVKEEGDNCKLYGGYCVRDESECKNVIAKKNGYDFSEYFKTDDDTKCKKEKENKICCYSPYDCLNKGGLCLSNPPGKEYLSYSWNCPSRRECWIKKENYWSYLDYIQSYGGNGAVNFVVDETVIEDGTAIKPGESYAITFGSPTDECDICTKLGITAGFVGGVMLCMTGVGCGGGIPLVISALSIAATTGAGGVVGVITEKSIREAKDLFNQRDKSTIYFSKLNAAEEKCNILVD